MPTVACPRCRQPLRVGEGNLHGRQVRCPQCGQVLQLPEVSSQQGPGSDGAIPVSPAGLPRTLSFPPPGPTLNRPDSVGEPGPGPQGRLQFEVSPEAERIASPSLVEIPGYQILKVLGRGGMGVVYQAVQTRLKRTVALKMILSGVHAARHEQVRFRLEAEALARLQHPHIVQIYEVNEHQGNPFFSMEFVGGGSLAEQLAHGPMPAEQAVVLLEELALAMEASHQVGVVHRDLKPANVLLTAQGKPKITDFGLAKTLDQAEHQTRTGAIMGTPVYMSPEQAQGKTRLIGPLTDVYALGAIFYECLTGQTPFAGPTEVVLFNVIYMDPRPPRQLNRDLHRTIHRDVETICLKCLHKDPDKRYASAQALAEDIQRFRRQEPILARRTGWAEKALLGARRRPTSVAVAVLALLLVSLMGVAGLITRFWWDASRARNALAEAKEQLDGVLYARRIGLAQARLDEEDFGQTYGLLRECPRDFRDWEWRYLAGRCPLRASLEGHRDEVRSVCVSSDGKSLACGNKDGTVKLWDLSTGEDAILSGHKKCVRSVCFSPNGQRLASASEDNTVRLWDVKTGRQVDVLRDHPGGAYGVCFHPENKQLASGTGDGNVKIWDVEHQAKHIRTFNQAEVPVTCVAFSPGGRLLASGSMNEKVVLWKWSTGDKYSAWEGCGDDVLSVCFSPDGKLLAAGIKNNRVKVWDVLKRTERYTLTKHKGGVSTVSFSPDGKQLASGSQDQTVRVWNTFTGQEVLVLKGHTGAVTGVHFGPTPARIISGSSDRTIKVWELTPGSPVLTLQAKSPVSSVCFGPGPKQLVLGCKNNTVQRWDIQTGKEMASMTGHSNAVLSVCSNEKKGWIASGSMDNTVKVMDLRSGTIRTLGPQQGFVLSVCLSSDGRYLASAGEDGTVILWNADTGKKIHTLQGHDNRVVSVCFSPAARYRLKLASASYDKTIKIWDVRTGKPGRTLRGHTGYVSGVCFSPSGKYLASSSWDRTVKVWKVATGEERLTLHGHTDAVSSMCFSPDGQRLVSGSNDRNVKLWDVSTGEELLTLKGHTDWVTCVCFSGDGNRIASASEDGTVKVWSTTPHRSLTLPHHHQRESR